MYNLPYTYTRLNNMKLMLQPHVKDIIEGSEYPTYKTQLMAMVNSDKECDMAGVTALCILTGVS